MKILIEKSESDELDYPEYTIFVDDICIGSYVKEGLILESSDGTPISFKLIEKIIRKLKPIKFKKVKK